MLPSHSLDATRSNEIGKKSPLILRQSSTMGLANTARLKSHNYIKFNNMIDREMISYY